MRHLNLLILAFVALFSFSCKDPPPIVPDTDTEAPTVETVLPSNGANNISSQSEIIAVFSEQVDPETVTPSSFQLSCDTESLISGLVIVKKDTARFIPGIPLTCQAVFTVTLTTDIKDLAGNALAEEYSWNFATEPDSSNHNDTTSPTVLSVSPLANAENVPVTTQITATFSEALQPTSISSSSFKVYTDGHLIAGTVTYANLTATFSPDEPLAYDANYQARLETSIVDLSGNRLATDYNWSFTTEPDLTVSLWTLPDEKYEITDLDIDVNGNVYVTGLYEIEEKTNGFYAKFNADGSFSWLHELVTENYNMVAGIQFYNDYIYFSWGDDPHGIGNGDVHIRKARIDNGNKVWDQIITNDGLPVQVVVYSDFIITIGNGPLLKLAESNGNIIDEVLLPGCNYITDYIVTDNKIYCVGVYQGVSDPDIILFSLSHVFTIEWYKKWGTEYWDISADLINYDNHIYYIGTANTMDNELDKPFMVKYDYLGNLVTDTVYTDVYFTDQGFVRDVLVDQSGYFYFVEGPVKLSADGAVIWNAGEQLGRSIKERNGILYVAISNTFYNSGHKLVLYNSSSGTRIN